MSMTKQNKRAENNKKKTKKKHKVRLYNKINEIQNGRRAKGNVIFCLYRHAN